MGEESITGTDRGENTLIGPRRRLQAWGASTPFGCRLTSLSMTA